MRVLILGATGPSGILIVKEFFRAYPDGSAALYVRNPSKIPSELSSIPAITVIQGGLTDSQALASAFKSGGQIDAVVSALGPVPPFGGNPITEAYRTIIPIMATNGCKRFIALSTYSHPDPRDKFSILNWLMVTTVWLLIGTAQRDILTYSPLIMEECDKHDIDWTLVRVPILTMKEGQRTVAGYIGDGKVGVILSRVAAAEFFVKAIEGKEWVRKAPSLSSQ
ncbi:hypothetical protein QCA50_004466 [Cerrena zonata]|uniref:NAD(P)-binding domain-containing protein n=1 Tax=Cerrena zonata TaxID=2478898 RepID=A0AAW0GJK0_9APHY